MATTIPGGQTPLTEQQARSLAYWWGGKYQQISLGGEGMTVYHGVVVSGQKTCRPQADAPTQIFSLEEARDMENRRGFQEAANPDWVG